ncbi:putative membrane protein [Enterobacter sp. J49]|uniref:hypothetical protein n=1 Tax=Enterobacter sp. J49 TaxID=1903627 RepID=UPI000A38D72C|nr:hypothetical protein [Enterobacter sp. J49]OUC37000.1 putative membrane protein [Enterobacter sp. J49]
MTDFVKDKWVIVSLSFLTLLFIIAVLFLLKPVHRQVLSCSFDAFMYDRQHKAMVNKNTHLYFYADGSGFRTERGYIDTDKGRMFIDRDVRYEFSDKDGDGIFALKYTRFDRRIHDNAPDNIWGTESAPGTTYYMTITVIGPGIYLFRERGTPLSICTSVTGS